VSLTPFKEDALLEYADVLLPIVPFTENAGHYVNVEGDWQRFKAAVLPFAESRPAWKILRVLGNLFGLDDFDYVVVDEITKEIETTLSDLPEKTVNAMGQWFCPESLTTPSGKLVRIGEWPIYAVDNIVRRSDVLQESMAHEPVAIRINRKVAEQFKLKEGDQARAKQKETAIVLPVMIDERVPEHSVLLVEGDRKTSGLAASIGEIELERME